jgi:subtilase family serine protease
MKVDTMSNSRTLSTPVRFLAISAFALSLLPWSLGSATPVSAESLNSGPKSVVTRLRGIDLPDLHPTEIKVLPVPGSSQKLLCAAIENIGTANAGPFDVEFKIDGVVPPGGIVSAGKLDAGKNGELCVQTALPAKGQHVLSAVVDPADVVRETYETNNRFLRTYLGTFLQDVAAPKSTAGNSLAP